MFRTDGRFLFKQRLEEVSMTVTALDTVKVDGRTLAFREAGEGPAVLLLHGWPTSSFLWRNVMPAIARERRVLALDLPGFGASDKPTDVTYDYGFYTGAVGGFLDALEIDDVALGLHDLGGPVGVRFALDNPDRVRAVALTNTLLYPEDMTVMLTQFVEALQTPGVRERFTGADGIEAALRLGTNSDASVTDETIAGMVEPFASDEDRLALAKAGAELEDAVTAAIPGELPGLRVPVRVVYGKQDRILESIGDTVERLRRDLPQAEVTALDGPGHFLQEDDPERVGELLAEFFARH
jgi:pimeloyl-ACP methyl ester carboxylesterase